jgi:chromosome segregation ATPase
MEPEFKRLNQIYENNFEETRKFTKITETQKAKREAAMQKVLNAKQSLDENQAEIRKTARLIQSIAPEDADGDEAATEFLQKKRKDMDDHKIVRRTFQAELVHSERELREIDMESFIIRKKLEELAAAGVKAKKEKEAMDSAVRKWMFQIRILEGTGGWTKSLEQFGADFADGKFNGLSMPRNERLQ